MMNCPHCKKPMAIFSRGIPRKITTFDGAIPVQIDRLICRPCKYRTTDNCEIAPKGFSYGWDVIEQVVLLRREMGIVKTQRVIEGLGVKIPLSTLRHLFDTFS